MFIKEHRQGADGFEEQDVAKIDFTSLSQHRVFDVFLCNFGTGFHIFDDGGEVIGNDHIHGSSHVVGF